MKNDAKRLAAVSVAGIAFWSVANAVLKTQEPWDSPQYLIWYVGAIALAAVSGWLFGGRAWRWGALIMFSQLPVMLAYAGFGPLFAVGLGFTTLLALPACFASMGAAKARELHKRSRA